VLHHRPAYNNIAWTSFLKKMRHWAPLQARSFFLSAAEIDAFNTSSESWLERNATIKQHLIRQFLFAPLKTFLAQLKNGLWRSRYGWQVAAQQYVYYIFLYWQVWQLARIQRSKSKV
jgi:hypothetical protein